MFLSDALYASISVDERQTDSCETTLPHSLPPFMTISMMVTEAFGSITLPFDKTRVFVSLSTKDFTTSGAWRLECITIVVCRSIESPKDGFSGKIGNTPIAPR